MGPQTTRVQEFTIDGDQLLATVKELTHEGNVRRLAITSEDGRTLLEVPLTIGVTPAAAPPEPVTADTI